MKKLLLTNAIIWAAVILLASWLYNGSDGYIFLISALAIGFILQNSFTYSFFKKDCSKNITKP